MAAFPLYHLIEECTLKRITTIQSKMEAAMRMWKAAPRSMKVAKIDTAFSLSRFRKLVGDLPKSQIATLVRLRTGHIALNQHLHHIGKAHTPVCPCCQRMDETVHHFLIHCPAHATARRALSDALGRDAAPEHNLGRLHWTLVQITRGHTYGRNPGYKRAIHQIPLKYWRRG